MANFGESKLFERSGSTAEFAESARYMAPEILAAAESDDSTPGKLTKESDVYAFSMVALEVSKLPYI